MYLKCLFLLFFKCGQGYSSIYSQMDYSQGIVRKSWGHIATAEVSSQNQNKDGNSQIRS